MNHGMMKEKGELYEKKNMPQVEEEAQAILESVCPFRASKKKNLV